MRTCAALLLSLAATIPAFAASSGITSNALDQRSPQQWAADAAVAELRALNHGGPYLRYRMRVVNRKGDQVRDQIETHEGTVARLILRDGHPLTPDEDAAERARLNALISSPDDFFKHVRSDQSERKTAADLIQMLPDAMLYTYVAGQPQLPNTTSRHQIVVDYEPNPHWSPPTTTSEALTGLHGRIWIDTDTHAAVRMEGAVFRPVNVGWGMIAHIFPGGTFSLEQNRAGTGPRWFYTHYEQAITVRALLVKSLEIRAKVDTSDFQLVPDMGYADAIRILLNTPLPSR